MYRRAASDEGVQMGEPGRLEAIAPGERLLHIGLPKTGTTALQSAASQRREEFLLEGAHYPEPGRNHNNAVSAIMGRTGGTQRREPTMADWERLLALLDERPEHRSLISYELVCEADDETAARMVEQLGEGRTHIVITLRSAVETFPSAWQQYVKSGETMPFPKWAEAMISEVPPPDLTPTFWKRHDIPAIIERWARIVGPERVWAVVLDRERPALMTDAFEDLLGLSRGLLRPRETDAVSANRSLTSAEVELVRQVNLRTSGHDLGPKEQLVYVNTGIAQGLQSRRPEPTDAGGVPIPESVVEAGRVLGVNAADTIRRLGVNAVGDLDALATNPRRREGREHPETVSVAAAAQALRSLLSRIEGDGVNFERQRRRPVLFDDQILEAATTAQLEKALAEGGAGE